VAILDKLLVQSELLLDNLTLSSDIIPSSISDHKPIALSFHHPQNLGPIPFHFNRLWLHDSKALEIITET
jgi:hypothetical protein